jgi:hypothetical protein
VNIFKQIAFGNHLARMTTWVEVMERSRAALPVGMGGGIDSLLPDQQARALREMEAGYEFIRKVPRHLVTENLFKNREMALQFGRHERANAIALLYDRLVENDLALGAEDYVRSYAR